MKDDSAEGPSAVRLKVLVLAAVVHPDYGSEPGMGWHWIRSLSRFADLHVLTSEYRGNRTAIVRELAKDHALAERVQFVFLEEYWPRRDALGAILTNFFPYIYYYYYGSWHMAAFRVAKDLIQNTNFDLVHQLNLVGFREPGYLWQVNLPVVWGPVGGTSNVPFGYCQSLGIKGCLANYARSILNVLQIKFLPRVDKALKRVDGFVVANKSVQDDFFRQKGRRGHVIPEVGTTLDPIARLRSFAPTSPLRIVWSGLHIPRKALPIVLNALAAVARDDWQLHILGSGPCTKKWKRHAERLGILGKCIWHGWLPRSRAIEVVSYCDVFAISSLRETTSTVIMEAISMGLPCITTDHCGMSDVITDDCGIKVRMANQSETIAGFVDAFKRLIEDRCLLERLSRGAKMRAGELTWDANAGRMINVYHEAIDIWRRKRLRVG